MTHAEIATILFGNFSPEERAVPESATYPGRHAAIKAAINGALQEIHTKSPDFLENADYGVILHAPTEITIAVTEDSTAATITGYAAWMEGCEIVIDGHDIDNRINRIVNAGAGTVTLLYPYGSTTGSKSAVVYHTSIPISDTVMKVVKPVRVDNLEIIPVANPEGFTATTYGDFGNQFRRGNLVQQNIRVNDTKGKVCGYKVDSHYVSSSATPTKRMRIVPAPAEGGTLTYRAEMVPPFVTSLAATDAFPLANQFVESILLPIALFRLTSSPFFRNTSAIPSIEKGYRQALADLDALSAQDDEEKRMRPIYA